MSDPPLELDEALSCIASGVTNVQQASNNLGVSVRTLQRLLKSTGQPPLFWLRLARARNAARALFNNDSSDADIAHQFGFADQAHLSREIKYWFRLTPHKLKAESGIFQQLQSPAYS